MKSREVIRRIKDLDPSAKMVHQVGSHQKWLVSGGCRITVPVHPGDVPTRTQRSIERQGEPCLGKKWLMSRGGR